jgi:limonene-1,2-epoxide hydrolase
VEEFAMPANEQIVREFIKTWSTLDADRIVDFFAEDGVYHNMPIAPVSGRPQLRAFIAAFVKNWSATEWEIVNLVSAGSVVIAERMDRTKVGDKTVDLPCCGVFELRDGKIRMWRDYFDMTTYVKALAG